MRNLTTRLTRLEAASAADDRRRGGLNDEEKDALIERIGRMIEEMGPPDAGWGISVEELQRRLGEMRRRLEARAAGGAAWAD